MPKLGDGSRVYFDPTKTFLGSTAAATPDTTSVNAIVDTDVLLTEIKSVDFSNAAARVEVTNLLDKNRKYLADRPEVSGSFVMNLDDGATANQEKIFLQESNTSTYADAGQTGALVIRYEVGAGKRQIAAIVTITGIREGAAVGTAQERTVDFVVSGDYVNVAQ